MAFMWQMGQQNIFQTPPSNETLSHSNGKVVFDPGSKSSVNSVRLVLDVRYINACVVSHNKSYDGYREKSTLISLHSTFYLHLYVFKTKNLTYINVK